MFLYNAHARARARTRTSAHARARRCCCSTHGEDDEQLDRKAANDLYWKHLKKISLFFHAQ